MPTPQISFDTPDGGKVLVTADAQSAVVPGSDGNTATVIAPDGTRIQVAGDYRDVQVRLQAAAAQAHEGGAVEQANTPVS